MAPDDLPDGLEAVLLAVKAHHTAAAIGPVAPRLAADGFVVSLQNGFNEDVIAAAVGPRARGRRLRQLRRRRGRARADPARQPGGVHDRRARRGRHAARARARGSDIADARQTANIHGFLWSKEAYGAILFATAVSDLSIADALAEPRYRPLYLALAREVLAAATAIPEPFDGFDPADLEGSIDRLVEFNRGSAKTHSGIYRDLAVRHRKTEVDAMLAVLDGPLVRHTAALIHAIEDGRRACERANLELLAAYERLERLGRPLNAVIAVMDAPERAAAGPLLGEPIAVKDNIDVAGAGDHERLDRRGAAAGRRRRRVGRPRARRRRRRLLQDEPARVRRRQRQPGLRDDVQPARPGPHGGRVVERLGGARGRRRVRPRGRHRLRRLDPRPGRLLRHRRREADDRLGACGGALPARAAPATAWGRSRAPSPARPGSWRCCRGGRARSSRSAASASASSAASSTTPTCTRSCGRACPRRSTRWPGSGTSSSTSTSPSSRWPTTALGTIVLREAWDVHADRYRSEGEKYGPGTRALLDLASRITDPEYRDALADCERVTAGFARAFAQADVLAGPTMAYVAPPEDPPVRHARGRRRGPLHRAVQPGPDPGGDAPVRAGRARPAGRAAADGAAPTSEPLLLSVAAAYEMVAPR